jgi:hypothetical protein
MSQCATLHVAGWTWAYFTRVYLESSISLSPQSGNFLIHFRILLLHFWAFMDYYWVNFSCQVSGILTEFRLRPSITVNVILLKQVFGLTRPNNNTVKCG